MTLSDTASGLVWGSLCFLRFTPKMQKEAENVGCCPENRKGLLGVSVVGCLRKKWDGPGPEDRRRRDRDWIWACLSVTPAFPDAEVQGSRAQY